MPWFCNPTAFNSVTGPGMGSVNFYAAKAYAKQYPTLGQAEAAGFRSTFGFIPGMGTHHGKGTFTPEMLADPNFDRQDPVIPDSIMDDVFDPARPEFLQYNGNGAGSVLVGMSYYVRTDTGRPPAGFAGNNDWWHHHPTLCFDPATARADGVNTTDQQCARMGGVNVHLDDYYMLHVWLVGPPRVRQRRARPDAPLHRRERRHVRHDPPVSRQPQPIRRPRRHGPRRRRGPGRGVLPDRPPRAGVGAPPGRPGSRVADGAQKSMSSWPPGMTRSQRSRQSSQR